MATAKQLRLWAETVRQWMTTRPPLNVMLRLQRRWNVWRTTRNPMKDSLFSARPETSWRSWCSLEAIVQ